MSKTSKTPRLSAMDRLLSGGVDPALSQNDPKARVNLFNTTKSIEVDPHQCRLWEYADRPISETEHKEAIARSFQRQGIGQIQPVIVRPVQGYEHYQYEIICGHVRWLAAKEANRPLLAIVRELTDQDAYLIMQAENRERKDISDYAKARSFKRVLDTGLFGSRSELAELEGLSNSVISYYLGFASLPTSVVEAFHNISLIGYRVGYEIAKACEILGEQRVLELVPRIESGDLGKDDIRKLYEEEGRADAKPVRNAERRSERSASQPFSDAMGNLLFTFKKGTKGGGVLTFATEIDPLVDESLLEEIRELLAARGRPG